MQPDMNDVNFKVGFNRSILKIRNFSVSCNINFQPDSDSLIVFIHGLGCDKESFQRLFDYNDFEEYNILIPDLIGFGNSSKSDDFGYDLKTQAEILSELIEKFDIKKIHIVAHSMGGSVGLLFPPEIYSRVESFANIEGNLIPEDCNMFSRKIISESFEDYNDFLFNSHKKQFNQSRLLKLDSTNARAMYYSAKSLVKLSDEQTLLKDFKNLKSRKAYFFGEENMDTEILTKLNRVEKIMIAGCGHEMMAENPEEFYSRLYDFISNRP